MTVIVAAAAAAGCRSSIDSDPTPPTTLWASKCKGSLTRFLKKNNENMEVTENKPNVASKKTCICAPTSHAGSFRCHLHRTTEQKSEENHGDKDGSSESLEFVKMTVHRKLSYNKPQLSRFGRAAAFSC
ncbi:unnamed protein product [Dovyalis caffra]|uniref:Uncharacterized protein n=1 Tax=Dovyalis caffra TaxID=77055 RepID=A0AAV1SDE7_9ROSI|nr:unnamed protein product [Dovyalis caffra]